MNDFLVLLSPAAEPFLDEMARLSHERTLERFGRTMHLYLPLYLSNECANICTYCGFSVDNKLSRITLDEDGLRREISAIKTLGYDHILVVTGEAPGRVDMDYFTRGLQMLRPHFSHINFEVQPLAEEAYRKLVSLGLDGVVVYQETYCREKYRLYHPRGKKANFSYRLETPDRIGRARVHKIGIGVLLGLADWRVDSFFAALHLTYLKKRFWKSSYSVSFPRIRPMAGNFRPSFDLSDRELVQLICAWRLLDGDLDLHLSTRESETFRDQAFRLGITSMSAGSRTSPGAYSECGEDHLEQFSIDDKRSPKAVAHMLREAGYDPVWKDWDRAFF